MPVDLLECLGPKLRRQRQRLGLTLEELSGRSGISKPYLSLIETGRVPNPPSDEKLRRLEQSLGFNDGELVTQAHIQRTPKDVRAVLHQLMAGAAAEVDSANGQRVAREPADAETQGQGDAGTLGKTKGNTSNEAKPDSGASPSRRVPASSAHPTDANSAHFAGVLQELVERSVGNSEQLVSNAVPVVNRVSAGYPRDFSDLGYPPRVASDYISCPDIHDNHAFAARVHGDSMVPKYRQGDIVIFSPSLSARDGDDCFIRFANGKTTFKRVFFESGSNKDAMLRLQPRNERHRPQTVPSEQVAGLYKAVYRYQKVDED